MDPEGRERSFTTFSSSRPSFRVRRESRINADPIPFFLQLTNDPGIKRVSDIRVKTDLSHTKGLRGPLVRVPCFVIPRLLVPLDPVLQKYVDITLKSIKKGL